MNTINHKQRASHILLTMASFVVVIAGMSAAKAILVPFLLAGFIAIISAPPLFWLQRKGFPAWVALVIVMIGVFLIGLIVVGLVGSSVSDFTKDLPAYETKLRQQTSLVMDLLGKLGVKISGSELIDMFDPGAAMKLVATLLNNLGNVLANGFLILMTVIFMLLEASSFPKKLKSALGKHDAFSMPYFDGFISNLKHYMAIKTFTSLGTGLLVALWLAILGINYPMLWGLLAFLLNYVPNIGSIIAAVPAILLALVQFSLLKTLLTAAGYVVINLVIGSLIEPRFMGRGLGLSTLVVFLSLLFWGWVLGPAGMLLSVPLTMTAKIALDSRDETRWLSVLLSPESLSSASTKETTKGQPLMK